MANNVTNKSGPSRNLVYDSRNDASAGKKQAVIPTGGKSVAERARLFGTQVAAAQPKPQPVATKRNFVIPKKRDQQLNSPPNRRLAESPTYSAPVQPATRPVNVRPPPVQNHFVPRRQPSSPPRNTFRPRREPSPTEDPAPYSRIIRPTAGPISASEEDYPPPATTRQRSVPKTEPLREDPPPARQRSIPKTERFQDNVPPAVRTYPDNAPISSSQPTANYFQPIQDPLQGLLKTRPQTYTQVSAPANTGVYTADLRSFDLGSLLNRIQDDYVQNIRPYVASVQYVETDPAHGGALTAIGPVTPGVTRAGFPVQNTGVYQRPPGLGRSEYIATNGVQTYEQLFTKQPTSDPRYGPMKKQRRRKRFHNQASSPIHILGSTRRRSSDNSSSKLPTPPPTIPSEDEEEKEEATSSTKADEKVDSGEEEESSEEEELTDKPATTEAPVPPSKPTGPPPLPDQPAPGAARAVALESDSEESESDESDSDSDSDSDEEEVVKKPAPSPAVRPPAALQPVSRTVPPLTINNRPYAAPSGTQPFPASGKNRPFAAGKKRPSGTSKQPPKFTEKTSVFKRVTNIFRRKKS